MVFVIHFAGITLPYIIHRFQKIVKRFYSDFRNILCPFFEFFATHTHSIVQNAENVGFRTILLTDRIKYGIIIGIKSMKGWLL